MFSMEDGRIVSEVERGGWPWNQANMLKAVEKLWVVVIPRPAGACRWTSAGVEAAQKSGVAEFLGNPVAGDSVTDEQLEAFALSATTVESLASLGYFDMEGGADIGANTVGASSVDMYRWTAFGVQAAADAKVA